MRTREGIGLWVHLAGFLFLACCLLLAFPDTIRSEVSGVCSNCHTMHNSQNGVTVNGQADPLESLLINSCIPCHTNSGSTTIDGDGTPIVDNFVSPSNPLAGGNLYYVGGVNQNTGHNVSGVDSQDSTHGNTPPGGTGALSQQLSCAGSYGCHGDPTVSGSDAGIKGWHHGSKGSGSYRFLSATSGSITVVTGEPDDNWEQGTATSTNHNIYGANDDQSVSWFCARCHGLFHGTPDTGSASPFTRHPTENRVSKYTITESYEVNPYGFAPSDFDIVSPSNSTNYTETYGYVTCISCHRAHASPYYEAVRWDYKDTSSLATSIEGCITCHSDKN